MNRKFPVVAYLLLMALVPVLLAVIQGVPTGSVYKLAVLLLSLAAFGLVLGQFWLSRLLPRDVLKLKHADVVRWHKVVGYTAGVFLLVHPVLMIARRFWVEESDPIDNLLLMLRAPALLPAIVAWVLMVALVVFALGRRGFPSKGWRIFHGLLSSGFAGLATWHVVSVGRHSNAVMSVSWIVLAGSVVGALLSSYLPARAKKTSKVEKGVAHELAR